MLTILLCWRRGCVCVFFFNYPSTTEIYTLSLHDALPIWRRRCKPAHAGSALSERRFHVYGKRRSERDRKSTRLNSSHVSISYAVFCLKKKKKHDYVAVPQLVLTPRARNLCLCPAAVMSI